MPDVIPNNIYKRMLAATEEINKVAKNLKVDLSKTSSYKAVGEADVLEAVKPIEAKHGIYSYPVNRKIIEKDTFTTKSTYANGGESEKLNLFMRIETTYRFLNVDKPDEYIDITSYGDGIDTQDKAPGKAMTYSDKYALLKAYKIVTGDDPDQEGSKEMKKRKEESDDEADKIRHAKMNKHALSAVESEIKRTGIKLAQILKTYKVDKLEDMTNEQGIHCLRLLEKTPDKPELDL